MTRKEQRDLNEAFGRNVRKFIQGPMTARVDSCGSIFPTPTIENINAKQHVRVRMTRNPDGTVTLSLN